MTRFTWTPKRDQLLREYTRERFTAGEAARALGCTPEAVNARRRELRGADRTNSPAVAAVPRPVGVTPRRTADEYPGVCATAREAAIGSLLGDPQRDTVGTPPDEGATSAPSPHPIRRSLIDLSQAPSAMETRFAKGRP